MANTRADNVIVVDTDAEFDERLSIRSILYEAGTSGSVVIKSNTSGGNTIFSYTSDNDQYFPNIEIEAKKGIHVNVSGTGTIVYLFLK